MTYTVKGGTKRSWDREVGYGKPPEWYLKNNTFELELSDRPDLTKITEEHNARQNKKLV